MTHGSSSNMAHILRKNYQKADSSNLPMVDIQMLTNYVKQDRNFITPESRNVKAAKSGRESYGDDAIGYVQLCRTDDGKCHLVAAISPEHRVRSKSYQVEAEIHITNFSISYVKCMDCVASAGGCKHALAFLGWMYTKSGSKSVTEKECYWRKSSLSRIGSTIKYIKAIYLGMKKTQASHKRPRKQTPAGSFLGEVVEDISMKWEANSLNENVPELYYHFNENLSWSGQLDIHLLVQRFKKVSSSTTIKDFLSFCQRNMSEDACMKAKHSTINQSTNPIWFRLRYCRITASKLWEASNCKTKDGVLTDMLFGATRLKDTKAMKRGRTLESEVLKQISAVRNLTIHNIGLILSTKLPLFGASPDGITDEYVVEVKCPMTAQSQLNYIDSKGNISQKCKAQIMLQMCFAGKMKGLFCMAHFDFETSKNITIVEVPYDFPFLTDAVRRASSFWEQAIWPILLKV